MDIIIPIIIICFPSTTDGVNDASFTADGAFDTVGRNEVLLLAIEGCFVIAELGTRVALLPLPGATVGVLVVVIVIIFLVIDICIFIPFRVDDDDDDAVVVVAVVGNTTSTEVDDRVVVDDDVDDDDDDDDGAFNFVSTNNCGY